MDVIITIALIYFAYRGYKWYQNIQAQALGGTDKPREVDADMDFSDAGTPQPGDEDDYIEYEEVK